MSIIDNLFKELGDKGYTGALPNRIYSYLRDLGHTGSRSDMLAKEGGYKEFVESILGRVVPNFNGISQYVSIPTLTVVPSYTIKFKIRPNSAGITDAVIKADGATSNYIHYRSSGELRARVEDSTGGLYTRSSFVLSVGTTYEVEVIITPTSLEMLVDGVSQGTTPLNNPQDPTTTYSTLAAGPGGTRALNASIWDVEILGAVFPLDDGWENNPTARNTGTGGDGTFINMTEAAWESL